jgi:hypothetical protein
MPRIRTTENQSTQMFALNERDACVADPDPLIGLWVHLPEWAIRTRPAAGI